MRYTTDLAGKRFGRLVAIEPTKERKYGYVVWRCQCDCGNEVFVPSGLLVNGNTKSCGCEQHKVNDLTGQQFGKLVAVEPTEKRENGSVVWRCRCDCGNEAFVTARSLASGSVKSCGCGRVNHLAGRRFGKLTAIEPTEKRKGTSVVWRCKCDCGNEVEVSADKLVGGKATSCGCGRKKDLAGQRFGFLTVIEDSGERRRGSVVWRCRCDCGNEKLISTSSLAGGVKSCGCRRGIKGV